MIGTANAGHTDEFEFIEGPPERPDGCHRVDPFNPFYRRKDWAGVQEIRFWQQYDLIETDSLAPVWWVRRKAGLPPAEPWDDAYAHAARQQAGEGER